MNILDKKASDLAYAEMMAWKWNQLFDGETHTSIHMPSDVAANRFCDLVPSDRRSMLIIVVKEYNPYLDCFTEEEKSRIMAVFGGYKSDSHTLINGYARYLAAKSGRDVLPPKLLSGLLRVRRVPEIAVAELLDIQRPYIIRIPTLPGLEEPPIYAERERWPFLFRYLRHQRELMESARQFHGMGT